MNRGLTPIATIADNAVANIGQPIQGQYIDGGSPAGERLVDVVCEKLRAITKGYKNKMGSAQGEAEYKRQMLLAFAENNITNIEVCSGALAYYRANDEWMPTPAEFVKQVEKHTIGDVPNYKDAYLEYCRNYANPKHEWSHPIVRETVRLGQCGYEMKCLETGKAMEIYKRSYDILLRRFRNGEDITTPIPKAIPETITRPLNHKENKSMLAQMRGELGL